MTSWRVRRWSFNYLFLFSGGPDGEIGASMRYLSQRYAMPYGVQKGLLTDIGTDAAIRYLSFSKALLCF